MAPWLSRSTMNRLWSRASIPRVGTPFACARTTTITLDYTDYTHRYAPYVSHDGKTWTPLPADRVTLNERKTRATLKLDLPPGTTWVAAQPVSSSYDGINLTRVALFNANFSE